MDKDAKIQVPSDYYFKNYDSVERFVSYFYQVDSAIKACPKNVLEIGVGNKTVSNYLKGRGIEVVTCDFDAELDPDEVADIRKMPFADNSFDVVLACEILEHIPFEDFQIALSELKRVSAGTVIVSVPFSCAYNEIVLNISIPFIKKTFSFALRMPYFFLGIKLDENNREHYWEMGRKGYSKAKIRNIIKKYFKIQKEFHPILNSYHYFFILKK